MRAILLVFAHIFFFIIFFPQNLKSEKPPHGTATGAMQELVNCIYFGFFFLCLLPFHFYSGKNKSFIIRKYRMYWCQNPNSNFMALERRQNSTVQEHPWKHYTLSLRQNRKLKPASKLLSTEVQPSLNIQRNTLFSLSELSTNSLHKLSIKEHQHDK